MGVKNISVFGLGKLGSPLSAVLANAGFSVLGYDVNKEFVHLLNSGLAPVNEPDLQELIGHVGPQAHNWRLRATDNAHNAVEQTDATFIIVPTPSDDKGSFELSYVLEAARVIGQAIRDKKSYHLVVVTSTVMPGHMARVKDTLEEMSHKKCGIGFGLCYNPEFIALGNVIADMLNPDFVLIGESDGYAGQLLTEIYRETVIAASVPITRMNFINAELAKISLNSFVTMKISFANTIADICEKLPGGDSQKVLGAIGYDERIGHNYLKGAMGFGGPCFPRDNKAFGIVARDVGVVPRLAKATDNVNRKRPTYVNLFRFCKKVAVLGLSYKPGTEVVEESPSIPIVKALLRRGHEVLVTDPQALQNAARVLGEWENLRYCDQGSALSMADGVIIAVPWPEYRNIKPSDLKNEDVLIMDCWGILPPIFNYVNVTGMGLVE
jgi:UDPglucose 6-dehydrogenase